jgi:hypothetical protein
MRIIKKGVAIMKIRKRFVPVLVAFSLSVAFLPLFSRAEEKKDSYPLSLSQAFKLSGYTQVLSTFWDEGVDSFLIRRARLSLSGEVMKNVQYRIQVDAVKSPVLLDAIVEFTLSQNFSLRIGQFKVPFSTENLTSGSDLDTINRSQTVEKLCPGRDIGSQGRDIGATILGKFSIVECTVGVFNGAGTNKADINSQKDFGGRLAVKPTDFLTLAGAFYDGRHSSASGAEPVTRDKVGFELLFNYSAFSVKGEFIQAKDDKISKRGWFVQGGYFFIPKKLQAILKFDSYDKDRDLDDDRSDLLTFGLNWFLSGKTKLQVNYELYRLEVAGHNNSAILAQLQAYF